MRESEIEAFFKGRVRAMGGLPMKFISPGLKNVPDQVAIIPSVLPVVTHHRVIWVETKATGKKPREGQQQMLDKFSRLGAEVYWFNSMAQILEVV